MKKFDIIKDKWIKKINSNSNEVELIRLKSISKISYKQDIVSSILLYGDGVGMSFHYVQNELEQFKGDINFFENILFNLE